LWRCLQIGLVATWVIAVPHGNARADAPPEQIGFPSADGKTMLVGYLFKPPSMPAAQVPAVVMMHGRAGAYSSRANGIYDASSLSKRHLMWGRLWAQQGYIAVLVDGFGPRGYPQGFPRFSYKRRPTEVDEVSIRPLDAHGALAYLRSRADIARDRIALQGWSNGASAALAAMSGDASDIGAETSAARFRGALAFYPGCGLKGRFDSGYRPYAPVRVFHGTADEEVSPIRCGELAAKSGARGGDIAIHLYAGATHGFDDPSPKRRRVAANAAAARDAIRRAKRLLAAWLADGPGR
jgi:carboxymethylenebutenolidase